MGVSYPPLDTSLMFYQPDIQSQIFWLFPVGCLSLVFSSVRNLFSHAPGGLLILFPLLILWALFCRWLAQGGRYNESSQSPPISLKGKVIIVTGANAGIGKDSALRLAKLGGRVVMCCRDAKRGQDALDWVKRESGSSSVELMALDLSDLSSVQQFVKEFLAKYDRLDILLNNAGVMATPHGQTKNGYEMQFGTNHIGHFLLTVSLLPLLLKTKARVVNVTSIGHWFAKQGVNDDVINRLSNKATYDPWESYGISKLGNILLTRELNARFGDQGLVTAAVHPGGVQTELTKHLSFAEQFTMRVLAPLFIKTIPAGGDTQLKCCVDPQIISGEYYQDCHTFPTSKFASNPAQWAWLWSYSVRQVTPYITDSSVLALLNSKSKDDNERAPSSPAGAKQRKR